MIARLAVVAVIGVPAAVLIFRAARARWLFEIQRTGLRTAHAPPGAARRHEVARRP